MGVLAHRARPAGSHGRGGVREFSDEPIHDEVEAVTIRTFCVISTSVHGVASWRMQEHKVLQLPFSRVATEIDSMSRMASVDFARNGEYTWTSAESFE